MSYLHVLLKVSRRTMLWFVVCVIGGLALTAGAQTPGSLDTTPFPAFATGNGKIPDLAIGVADDIVSAVVVQPDGKIVMAGTCWNGSNNDFCVARLNADGSLDTSFDGPNAASPGNGKFLLPIGTSDESVNAAALQPDGKIVLAGTCQNGSNAEDFCLARLNVDGSLDASFNGPSGTGNGKFPLPIGTSFDNAYALALQPDGKIVVGGNCSNGDNYEFCIARLNADGSFDASFDGPDASNPGNGRFLFPIGSSVDLAYALALQPDGKIVLVGTCWNGSNNDFCVARLDADGALDASFDGPAGTGDGKFLLPIGASNDIARALALQPDGKILVAGYCLVGSDKFCVARLNADGSLDASFDGPDVSNPSDGKFPLPIGVSNDYAFALALQPDGKIVLAGTCRNASKRDFCVARLNFDGSLDTSFDGPAGTGDGKFLLTISTTGASRDSAFALTLQPDGKLLVAGGCGVLNNTDFCIARLHGGPFGAQNCKLDFDGNGLVTATIDGLIATRVMLGVRGPAVIGGIGFPANAKRNTWPLIRDYLVSQCGLSVY
jgi:uncharacterized delta-60 repeat protein